MIDSTAEIATPVRRAVRKYPFGKNPDIKERVKHDFNQSGLKLRDRANIADLLDNSRAKIAREILIERARKRTVKDSLTGLYNREGFDRNFEEKVRQARNHNLPLTVVFADLNELSKRNEISYEEGDKLIKNTSKLLMEYDSEAARWGGDEFGLLFNKTEAEVKELLENKISPELIASGISISIGVGEVTTSTREEAKESLRLTKKAMKRSKRIFRESNQRVISTIKDLTSEEILSTEDEERETVGRAA